MSKTKTPTGLALAAMLVENYHNDWGGGDEPEAIAASRFAVVVQRDDDAWVRGADSWNDLAAIEMECYSGTEGYDEWVTGVYDVATGENVAYHKTVTVRVAPATGEETGISRVRYEATT